MRTGFGNRGGSSSNSRIFVLRSAVWWRLAVVIGLLLLALPPTTEAAQSRRRPGPRSVSGPRNYDRSLTTWDPHGRLLQVEYALAAVDKSSPILAVLLDDTVYFVVSQLQQVHRLDHHLFLFATGVAGDATLLARQLRQYCQNHRQSYGEPPTVREVAETAAEQHHLLTRVPGIRPLGCTVLVAGVNAASGSLHLFQAFPGGSLQDCWHGAVGRNARELKEQVGHYYAARKDQTKRTPTERVRQDLAALFRKSNEDLSAHVWTLRAAPGQRGMIQASCFMDGDGPIQKEQS